MEEQEVQVTEQEMQLFLAIAKICHEANRYYCLSLGDDSQLAWADAPEWQKRSAIEGVIYHVQNPDAQPSDSHDNWMKDKKADGWVYGAVKDEEKKTHPCMVPYHHLPKDQKAKDYIFIGIVKSFFTK